MPYGTAPDLMQEPTPALRTNKELPSMDAMALAETATVARFVRREERASKSFGYSETSEGSGIAKAYLEPLSNHIKTELLKLPTVGLTTNVRPFLIIVQDLAPEVIALATLTGLLNSIVLHKSLLNTHLTLGHLIAGELWAAELIQHSPKMAARVQRVAKARRGDAKGRLTAARGIIEKTAAFRFKKHWDHKELLVAGNCLLNWALDALSDVFLLEEQSDGSLTPQIYAHAVAKGLQAAEEVLRANPVFVPSQEVPRPWSGYRVGGYWDARTELSAPLVRTHHPETRRLVEQAVKAGTVQPHIDGLNALMNVPWRINTRILEVVKWVQAEGIEIEGFPTKHDAPLPERLSAFEDDAALIAHNRHQYAKVKEHNRSLRCNRLLLGQDIATAERLAQCERFYTPFNTDWRGRLIPLTHFTFSRDDRVRALFMFADGLPIGEEGLWWLKIHVANSGDFDKISKRPFKERVAWVDENLAAIVQVADSPTAPTALDIWTKADQPFVFLASCVELAQALRIGPSYVTTLPVSFDGTCSGLQHLCAMTRAPEGSLVNLTPTEAPQDVYQIVADVVKARALADLNDPDKSSIAKVCLDAGIDRKLVKRNTMTYFYSAKERGLVGQQLEDTMKPLALKALLDKNFVHPYAHPDDTKTAQDGKTYTKVGETAAKYLAHLTTAAIEQVVELPAKAMKFLQGLSNKLAHEGKPLTWTTPSGFVVENRYHLPNMTQVELFFGNKRYQMHVAQGHQKKLDKAGAARGVAPNFVHSMDAAHLFLTVNACVREGITSIATVHDSFGCLAPQATRFNAIIREQFVSMYETHDVLAEVYETAKANLDNIPKGFPEPPAKGSLNIKDVLNAPFTFA